MNAKTPENPAPGNPAPGKLWGVGLGPGDSDLVTVKAARVIGTADVVAYHCARHGRSIARGVAAPYLSPGVHEERLMYPVTVEGTAHPGGYAGALADFYEESARVLAAHLRAGRSVALLAEGDPLFYSSYMHMHKRLHRDFDTEIIPGVTSITAVAAATGIPLVEADEVLTVLPGTLPRAELARRLADADAVAIMKLGRTFANVQAALEDTGLTEYAWYVERASTTAQRVLPLAAVDPTQVPYFAMVVVPGARNQPRLAQSPGAAADTAAPTAGEVVVVGLGPGASRWTTPEVNAEIAAATDIVGYLTYTNRVTPRPGQRIHASDNKVEAERAEFALDLASRGHRVAVVSSGDPGVFAMAAAVCEVAAEPRWHDISVRVVPGVTAANAVAARVGAPLGHDYAVISLSDRLKPWEVIATRIRAAVTADLAIAIYNPGSGDRTWQVAALKELLLKELSAQTPIVVGRDVGGSSESVRTVALADLEPTEIDMRTLLIVGSTQTHSVRRSGGGLTYTARRYPSGGELTTPTTQPTAASADST